jgi:hypothetical protein
MIETAPKTTTWFSEWMGCMKIDSIEVVKDTDKFLFDKNGRRTARVSSYRHWYPTHQEAVNAIRGRIMREFLEAERRVQEFNGNFPEDTIKP